ncbi:accessory gene regulator ArgB-like protein [Paenibacillus sp. URB8-2]|uniref:accessory gene regulator ArgB-like protein n=1 Tax=Paenibacillus sp. URB8-2 TaxID=2741301 RepID=UPI0015B8B444|nr:accessory gene regulator B family protein [Paenibacillus sp. URB8-2]
MNSLANKIATAIKKTNPEQTCSIEVMQYSLGIILNTTLILFMTMIIGGATGHLTDSLIFLFSFALLRFCSGGFHLKTPASCNIVTTLLSTITPQLFTLTNRSLLILNIISFIIMMLFSPNPDRNAQIPTKLYPALKIFSLLLIGYSIFSRSPVIGLAFFVQSLTVIPLVRRFRQ